MDSKKYVIYNLISGKFYSAVNGRDVEYVDEIEEAKIITEEELGNELINLRLLGELIEHKEV